MKLEAIGSSGVRVTVSPQLITTFPLLLPGGGLFFHTGCSKHLPNFGEFLPSSGITILHPLQLSVIVTWAAESRITSIRYHRQIPPRIRPYLCE